MKKYSGTVCVVTGGGSGIGEGLARRFVAKGKKRKKEKKKRRFFLIDLILGSYVVVADLNLEAAKTVAR
jgi:NAD(P)-dependent dehydrogenase (short-subunit alcohol dehydrogenase family)